jgi:AcrR family transcriptional regulator
MATTHREHTGEGVSSSVPSAAAPDRILAAATRFFLQLGYEGTSVTRIAKEAGMTPANIYWHFPSKLDLLNEVLHTLYRNSYAELAKSVGDGPAKERLDQYVRAYVAIQLSSTDAQSNFGYSSLASALSAEDQHKLNATGRPYIELLRDILHQGTSEGVFHVEDVTVTSYAISTMCEYVFTWFRSTGALDVDQIGDHYSHLVLQMVARR